MDNMSKDYRKNYSITQAAENSADSASTITITPVYDTEIIEIDLDTNATINLASGVERNPGQRVIFKISSDGTARDVTFGTNFTAPALAGVINKTKVQEFVWITGSGFVAVAAPVQIN